MPHDTKTARRLRRSALMLTAAALLSGCIFGEDSEPEVRPATVFTSMGDNTEMFIGDVQAEIDYLIANEPDTAASFRRAIIQIAGLDQLSVDPDSFQGAGPSLPDFTSIDPKSPQALRSVYSALEDRLDRGLLVEDFPIVADEYVAVGYEKYQEAAGLAVKVLEKRRAELRDRQEQVRSIGGQVAFVKPVLGQWSEDGVTLNGQIVNLGPLPLVELGLRASRAQQDQGADPEVTQLAMADLLLSFDPALRSGETRTIRDQVLSVEGETAEAAVGLTGPIVVTVRHVTPLDGGRLTGDEYAPALQYLEDMQQQIEAFVESSPQKIRDLASEIE